MFIRYPLLNWATQTISLFNTLVLLWLGLTVLFNAERRTAGIYLSASQLLLGSAFFFTHSVILEQNIYFPGTSIDFWWRFGWLPVVLLPLAWYGVILWYSGFWNEQNGILRRRHRFWLIFIIGLALLVLMLLVFANPVPSLADIERNGYGSTPGFAGIPALAVVYPLYILLCLVLATDVLRHPAPPARLMGELARQRARPWLSAASIVLILVSVLVGWVIAWVISRPNGVRFAPQQAQPIAWFDLIIAGLIALAIVLVGQAVVAYEVFTGKSLPRRGLRRFWYRMVLLAISYAGLASAGLMLSLPAVYLVLISGLLLTFFFARLSWHAFAERERSIHSLQPFIASRSRYSDLDGENVLPDRVTLEEPFRSLCTNVLTTRSALLIPGGAIASLVPTAISYPSGAHPSLIGLPDDQYNSTPEGLCVPLADESDPGWEIPLWDGDQRIGALLLASKMDGSLYSEEEIIIARNLCERVLLDLASIELRRRLIELKSQRLMETRLLDQHTRQFLHDEILPQLHTAMLNLSSQSASMNSTTEEALSTLGELHHHIAGLLRTSVPPGQQAISNLGLVDAWRAVLDTELKSSFHEIIWELDPQALTKLEQVPSLMQEVLYYAGREAMRNSAYYASPQSIPTRMPTLTIQVAWQSGIVINFCDNGQGMDYRSEKILTGHGLDLHSTLLAVIGGKLAISSQPGESTCVQLALPARAWRSTSN